MTPVPYIRDGKIMVKGGLVMVAEPGDADTCDCCTGECECLLCSQPDCQPDQIEVVISGVGSPAYCDPYSEFWVPGDCTFWNDSFFLDFNSGGDYCVWADIFEERFACCFPIPCPEYQYDGNHRVYSWQSMTVTFRVDPDDADTIIVLVTIGFRGSAAGFILMSEGFEFRTTIAKAEFDCFDSIEGLEVPFYRHTHWDDEGSIYDPADLCEFESATVTLYPVVPA